MFRFEARDNGLIFVHPPWYYLFEQSNCKMIGEIPIQNISSERERGCSNKKTTSRVGGGACTAVYCCRYIRLYCCCCCGPHLGQKQNHSRTEPQQQNRTLLVRIYHTILTCCGSRGTSTFHASEIPLFYIYIYSGIRSTSTKVWSDLVYSFLFPYGHQKCIRLFSLKGVGWLVVQKRCGVLNNDQRGRYSIIDRLLRKAFITAVRVCGYGGG